MITHKKYENQSVLIYKKIEPLLKEWAELTADWKRDNPDANFNSLNGWVTEDKMDTVLMGVASIKDMVNGTERKHKNSLYKKVRKLLGFTYP